MTWTRRILEALGVSVAFAVFSLRLRGQLFSSIFQARDLERAAQLVAGHPIFFGPEVSGGGHLPGGLFYYFLALPVALGQGWEGAWILELFMCTLTLSALWLFVRKFFGLLPAVVLASSFATSFSIERGLVAFNNASYVFLFVGLSVVAVCVAYAGRNHRERWWYLASLAIGVGLQFHFIICVILLAAIFVQIFARRLGLKRLHARPFALGIILIGVTTIPYLIWSTGIAFGQEAPPFTGHWSKALDFLWIQSQNHFESDYQESFRFLKSVWNKIVPSFFVLAGLLFWRRRSPALTEEQRFARACTPILAVMLIFSLSPIFLPTFERYMVCAGVMMAIFPAAIFAGYFGEWRWRDPVVALWLLLIPLEMGMRFANVGKFADQEDKIFSGEYEELSRVVAVETGWDFEMANQRMFFVSAFKEQSMRPFYNRARGPGNLSAPAGYFVVLKSRPGVPADLVDYLLPEDIREGLTDGGIEVGAARAISPRLDLIPYKVKDIQNYPPYFHNRGEGYSSRQEKVIDSLAQNSATQITAVFNRCEGQFSFCRVALTARSLDLKDPRNLVRIEALGSPLAFDSQWISPDFTQALIDPFVRFHCADRVVMRRLVHIVGFHREFHRVDPTHSLLAPLVREIYPHCRGPISEIELGYARTRVETFFQQTNLAGETQTFNLN